jgi:predicted GNAT superfamily acetyltransferase
MPADIDALLANDPEAAFAWRYALRSALVPAFEQGYAVTGFSPATGNRTDPALVLTRVRAPS